MSIDSLDRYFSPGERLHIPQRMLRSATPAYDQVEIEIPGRLHFGVLDFSKMGPGLGGGGLGISTDTVAHKIKVSRTADGGCDIPSGQHLLALFKKMTGYAIDDIQIIKEASIQHQHSGFGSNVSFNTAVITALNMLFGSPYSPEDIWHIVTQNYVENAEDNKGLYFGLDTGVGEACFLYGGLVWIDASHGNGKYVGNVKADNLWVVTAVGNRITLAGELLKGFGEGAALSDKTETDLVASHFMECEKRYGPCFKKFMKYRMAPAILKGNLNEVLTLGWDLNQLSNIKVLEGIYRADVLNELCSGLKAKGALYAGMSSAGPGFFAFAHCEEKANELANFIESEFGDYFSEALVGRAGSKMKIAISVEHQQRAVA